MKKEFTSTHLKFGEHTDDGTLIVGFRDGSTYHYKNVPADTCTTMIGCDNPSQYFRSHIKGKYKGAKQ